MPVVTISGTSASGAREVGQRVAYLLGVDFVDQQLMVQAAQRCGVPVGALAQRDERSATMRQRISSAFNTLLERSGSSGADSLTGATGLESILSQTYADMAGLEKQAPISDKLYAETMETIIRELATSGQIVILGRGSQMILRDVPRAVHALCISPANVRYQRLAERDEVGLDEARRRAIETDQARDAFYRKFWKMDVEDAKLYDMTLDTSRLGFEAAAEVTNPRASAIQRICFPPLLRARTRTVTSCELLCSGSDALHGLDQQIRVQRFWNRGRGAKLALRFLSAIRRDDHDLRLVAAVAHLAIERAPVHARHLQVEQDDVERAVRQPLQANLTVRGRLDTDSRARQRKPQHAQECLIVVDYQYPERLCALVGTVGHVLHSALKLPGPGLEKR